MRSVIAVGLYSEYFSFALCTCMPSMYVSLISPALTAFRPVNGVGRNAPARVIRSPGESVRVSSPCKCTVMILGMWPTGTWSAVSCNFTS